MTASTGTLPSIPLFGLRLEPQDLEAVAETLRSGRLTLGARAAEFERAFAGQLGSRHAVSVSSCTAALHLAYLAAGVGPGDEVIVPSFTFASTANAAIYCGGKPIFADILGQHDLGIDPADVERRITPRTKAVCAVHFAGYPAAVDRLSELCRAYGLALIEDAAHTPSATLQGRKLGTFGLAGAFSFYSNKVLSAGEGGLLATDSDEVAELARRLRTHAMTHATGDRPAATTPGTGDGSTDPTDTCDVSGFGFSYRIDEPRAALLLSRLGRMEHDIARRRELVLRYRRRLAGLRGMTLPYRDADVATASAYVMPVMLTEPGRQRPFRRLLLSEHGVQTSLLYPAVHEFSYFRRRYGEVSLPRTELAARTEVTLPLYPHMTVEQQDRVVGGVKAALAR